MSLPAPFSAAVSARGCLRWSPPGAAPACGPSVPAGPFTSATAAAAPACCPPARGSAFQVLETWHLRTPRGLSPFLSSGWPGAAHLCLSLPCQLHPGDIRYPSAGGVGVSWVMPVHSLGALLVARESPLSCHTPLIAGPSPVALFPGGTLHPGEAQPRTPRGVLWQSAVVRCDGCESLSLGCTCVYM